MQVFRLLRDHYCLFKYCNSPRSCQRRLAAKTLAPLFGGRESPTANSRRISAVNKLSVSLNKPRLASKNPTAVVWWLGLVCYANNIICFRTQFPASSPAGATCYSATGASTGQAAAQEPQSMQSSLLISYFPSFSLIASTGHSAAHAPQPMQASVITYAIKIHLHKIFAESSAETIQSADYVAIISYF